ncbi:MAG: hypothetical protein IJ649_09715 [Oscillospiraceae bacterium]|nr:hypothetical protein [Oscillospiraceae bacterium]
MTKDKQIQYDYKVCAVLFGTDESILNICLKDGFSFVKRSLRPKDHLDQVFDISDIGLRRAYETARLDNSTLDVICIEKSTSILMASKDASGYYDNQVDRDLVLLDNQIRAIRLIKECALRCTMVSFKMRAEDGDYGPIEFNSMIPISESLGSPEISKFHCDHSEVQALNSLVNQINFPLINDVFNVAHRFYDRSYLEDNYIALVLLITSLEMLFLSKQDEKKVPLAKRCAVYMDSNRIDQVNCYNRLINAYKQRSDFVHDGVFNGIDDQTIIFLRSCVRKVLLSIDPATYNKPQFIQSLKARVDILNSSDPGYWTL